MLQKNCNFQTQSCNFITKSLNIKFKSYHFAKVAVLQNIFFYKSLKSWNILLLFLQTISILQQKLGFLKTKLCNPTDVNILWQKNGKMYFLFLQNLLFLLQMVAILLKKLHKEKLIFGHKFIILWQSEADILSCNFMGLMIWTTKTSTSTNKLRVFVQNLQSCAFHDFTTKSCKSCTTSILFNK